MDREIRPPGDRDGAAGGVDARAHGVPRRRERPCRAADPARPQLAERLAARAHEEPADERLGEALLRAPRGERRRAGEADDAHPRAGRVVTNDVERGPRPAGQPQPKGARVRRRSGGARGGQWAQEAAGRGHAPGTVTRAPARGGGAMWRGAQGAGGRGPAPGTVTWAPARGVIAM